PVPTPNATNVAPIVYGPYVNNIFINEFMASNTNTLADSAGDFDDWIELYNAGTDSVDVGGLYITDDLADPTLYQIPATDPSLTTIPPNGFLLLWADSEVAQGVLHVDLKLGAGGEQIGLVQINGDSTHFVDSLTFGPQMDDTSSGRTIDGGPLFTTFPVPTPNATNVAPIVYGPYVNNIFINEFMASNTVTLADSAGDFDDWIELYNAGGDSVDVGGLYIT
ncbi:MAG: lamin tail domain-containing protein, partial [Bacteroidetes bacterium]|nr:lamin tail domain-containing protein [Bacteroidota bacterium]